MNYTVVRLVCICLLVCNFYFPITVLSVTSPSSSPSSSFSSSSSSSKAFKLMDLLTVNSDGRYCISFSPFPRGYSPPGYGGIETPKQVVFQLLDQLFMTTPSFPPLIKCLLLYSATGANAHVIEYARIHDIPLVLGIFLGTDAIVNDREIQAVIEVVYGQGEGVVVDKIIAGIVCGYELRLKYDQYFAIALLDHCFHRLRSAGIDIPVGTMGTWPELCDEDYSGGYLFLTSMSPTGGTHGSPFLRICGRRWNELARLDPSFLLMNSYAFYENRNGPTTITMMGQGGGAEAKTVITLPPRFPCILPEFAGEHHVERLLATQYTWSHDDSNGDDDERSSSFVALGEFGWPGPDSPAVDLLSQEKCGEYGGSVASIDAKYRVAHDTLRFCQEMRLPCILFTSIIEPWKNVSEGFFGQYLGFCSPDPPFACDLPRI